MDLQKLKTLILGRGLWLARLDQFRTPYEGKLPDKNRLGLLSMFPSSSADWLMRQYELGVLRGYASCWHCCESDPVPEVWRDFDPSGQGVAVRIDFEELARQLSAAVPGVNGPPNGGPGPVHVGSVRYIDHDVDDVPEGNVLEAAFVVREKWSYQRELRVLIHTHGTAAAQQLVGRHGPFGPLVRNVGGGGSASGVTEFIGAHFDGRAIVLGIDPDRLVEEIVPNPAASWLVRKRLAILAYRSGLRQKVRRRPWGAAASR